MKTWSNSTSKIKTKIISRMKAHSGDKKNTRYFVIVSPGILFLGSVVSDVFPGIMTMHGRAAARGCGIVTVC